MGIYKWILLLWKIIAEIVITCLVINWEVARFFIPRSCKSVKGQVVVVTGAGHGLGKNISIHMGRLHATVVCLDKDAQANSKTVHEIKQFGGCAFAYTVDVSSREQVVRTGKEIEEQVGHVTILINNAGIYPVNPVMNWTHQEISELMEVNFYSHFWTIQTFLPGMISRNNGHVVAISSAAAIAPVASEVPYSASKAAVTALMDGLQQEMYFDANCRIKFTTIHPYYTATRTDLPVKFDIRFERLSPDYVSAEIVKGILQEREIITVPRFMLFWIQFVRCLPQTVRHRWREVFFTRVYPEKDSVNLHVEEPSSSLEQKDGISLNTSEIFHSTVKKEDNTKELKSYYSDDNTRQMKSGCVGERCVNQHALSIRL